MSKAKLRKRHKAAPRKPKLPISNITGFPSGMSHADLRRKFPVFKCSIVEGILASERKTARLLEALGALPFKVRFDGF